MLMMTKTNLSINNNEKEKRNIIIILIKEENYKPVYKRKVFSI